MEPVRRIELTRSRKDLRQRRCSTTRTRREYDAGIWHGFVRGVGPGQAYSYRATGPWDPRWDTRPAKRP